MTDVADTVRRFPAKFSKPILHALEAELRGRLGGIGVVIDPFAGVGGVHALADALPAITTVGIEIEPEFAACHERTVCGDSLTLGDPTSATATAVLDLIPHRPNAVVTSPAYGNRLCLAAGTLVTAWEGPTPIEHIQPGTLVLTHTGRWRPVTGAWKTGTKPVVKITGQGATIRCTADHRVWSARKGDNGITDPKWRTATDMAQRSDVSPSSAYRFHYWATPAEIDPPRLPAGTPRGDAVWYLIGFYLGNGSVGYNSTTGHASTVMLSKDRRHADIVGPRLEASGAKRRPDFDNMAHWHLYDGLFAEWVKTSFGTSAYTKTVPGWTLGLSIDERSALLNGWLDADGCERLDRPTRVGVSVSERLIRGMQLTAASVGRSVGYSSCDECSGSIMGVDTRFAEAHRLDVHSGISRKAHAAHGAIWYAVRSVEPDGEADVYDLEVDGDHSFIANGVAVHNSDQYLGSANEKCRRCMGDGWVPTKEWVAAQGKESQVDVVPPMGMRQTCPKCSGTGKAPSSRQGYAIAKGAKLSTGSGAALRFGKKYETLHRSVFDAVAKFVGPDTLWLVNVSSFIRGDRYVEVAEWWVGEVARHATVEAMRAVPTARYGFGQNSDARVPVEHIIIARS